MAGSDHHQMLSGQGSGAQSSHSATTAGSSTRAEGSPQSSEAHSSQIATDAGPAAGSSQPASDVAAEQPAPVIDAPSGHVEPEQCPSEIDDYLSPTEADEIAESDMQTEGTVTSPRLSRTADLYARPAVDSEAESRHFAQHNEQVVPRPAAESSQPVTDSAVEPQAPAVDASADHFELQQPPPEAAELVAEHDQQAEGTTTQPGSSVTPTADQLVQPTTDLHANSQHIVALGEEEITPAADETISDNDSELTRPQSVDQHELHRELADSHSDSSEEEFQTSDITDDHDTAANDVERNQPTAEPDHSGSDDDIVQRHIGDERTQEQTEQPMRETNEAASDQRLQSADQQQNVGADEVPVESHGSVDELAPSGNVDLHLKAEGMTKTTTDEQVSVADGKDGASVYLAPVVNLLAALDAWLVACIDSVSTYCVIVHCT